MPFATRQLHKTALLIGAAFLTTACVNATQITPEEVQIRDDLDVATFMPATRQMRDSIETQEMFAQAAFWSREYDLNPSDLESAIKLAAAVRKLGNPQRAVEITQTTRALYPRDPYLTAEYVAALIASERAIDALQPLDEALAIAPNYARLWSLKGAALDQQEQYDLARKHYQRAMQITPNDPSILANLGLSYALAGDAPTAETWLRRAVALPGASPAVHQNLALVLQLQGKGEEASRIGALTARAQKLPPKPVPAQSYQPRSAQQPTRQAAAPVRTAPVAPARARQTPMSNAPQSRFVTQSGPNGQPYSSASEAARAMAAQRGMRPTAAPTQVQTQQNYDPAEQQAVLDRISQQLRGRQLPPEHAAMQKQANQQAAWQQEQMARQARAQAQMQGGQAGPMTPASAAQQPVVTPRGGYPQMAGGAAQQAPRGASRRRR